MKVGCERETNRWRSDIFITLSTDEAIVASTTCHCQKDNTIDRKQISKCARNKFGKAGKIIYQGNLS